MSKKIFDIKPPGKRPLPKKEVREKTKKSFPKGIFLIILFFVFLGFSAFFLFSKIKMEIWPEIDKISLNDKIEVVNNSESIDFENNAIPGRVFIDQKSENRDFPATGKATVEEKASGTITVYNAYSTSSQTLVENTRFVSSSGKLFRSVQKEVIPGGRYEGGKFIPGQKDIEVKAAEPGEDYNIEPTTFSIPGFKGTSRYTYFYGKSFSNMVGGYIGDVSKVTEEDIENAKNSLVIELKQESKDFLKSIIPEGYILLDEAISQEITESSSSVEANTTAESFNATVRVKSKGLAFKRADIMELLVQKAGEEKKIKEEGTELNYTVDSFNEDKTQISLSGQIIAYENINLEEIKRALFGKTLQEAKIFLGNLEGVSKVEINSWPFWRKRVPEDHDKFEIKLNLRVD